MICPHNEIRLVTKINTFFIVFHFDDDEHGLKIKKAKTASKFWYIYGSVTFFCLSVFSFFAASLLHLSESLHRQKGALPSARLSIHPSIRPSVRVSVRPPGLDLLCRVLVSCFLSVGGRGHSRKREQYAGQTGTVIWLCTHSWSVHGFQQTAALFPKV